MGKGRKHRSTHKESGGTSDKLKKDAVNRSGESESYSRKSQSNMSKLVGAQGSRKHSQQKKTYGGVSQMDLARVRNQIDSKLTGQLASLNTTVLTKLASMAARLDAQGKNFTEFKKKHETALPKLLAAMDKRVDAAETAQEYFEQ